MKENKKKYTTPRLRTVQLETREVMADICKSGGDDMNVGLPVCGVANPCSDLGS